MLNLLRKEWIDIKRDKKLVLGSVVLPLLLLPLIGIIIFAATVSQPPTVDIINNSPLNEPYVINLEKYIKSNGGIVYTNSSVPSDVQIIFPKGFYENITSINRTAVVYISYVISSSSNALSLVENGLYNILYNVSIHRIQYLANRSDINISPSIVRDPIVVSLLYKLPTGGKASASENQFAQLARIVAIILFPASTPVIFFVTDSIMGEKERRTLESLLASPISARSFLGSKLAISMLLGIISSIGDLAGLVIFSLFAPYIVGESVTFSLTFAGIIIAVYMVMILLTASLSMFILLILGGSVRNIQIVNFIITTFGMLASFSSLFLNFGDLSFPLVSILGIPYVQLVASIMFYVFGLIQESIFSLLGTLGVAILLLLLSSKFLDSERLLLK
ncbi:ABC transporter permease [Acidianus sp. DSM 29099]|nr:ABC transporter permease [Acidianus sp. RZ1]